MDMGDNETADVIPVNSNPGDSDRLILFSTGTYKNMMQNLFWGAGYNIVAVPLATGHWRPSASPQSGGGGHPDEHSYPRGGDQCAFID